MSNKWKLKFSFAKEEEHALIYTSEYNGFEVVQEIHTKKKYGKFADQKTIYYASTLKPIFDTWDELEDFLSNLKNYDKVKAREQNERD